MDFFGEGSAIEADVGFPGDDVEAEADPTFGLLFVAGAARLRGSDKTAVTYHFQRTHDAARPFSGKPR